MGVINIFSSEMGPWKVITFYNVGIIIHFTDIHHDVCIMTAETDIVMNKC